jgi:hypothetical protein
MLPDRESRRAIAARMQVAASRMRLPFRGRIWRGASGSWHGAGAGSSIDFQDHRAYLPGDDPRHIDWAAYARSGHYSMKLYREEVSPAVEIVLDVSASMFVEERKATRVLELFYFSLESSRQSGASVRCHLLRGNESAGWPVEAALGGGGWDDLPWRKTGHSLPWRQGSLRVLISDLLFPGHPEPWLAALAGSRGTGMIFSPFAAAEADPDWAGNIEFRDCESGHTHVQMVSPGLLDRYRTAWRRHFALWDDACRRHRVVLAQVCDGEDFLESLQWRALPRGAVEVAA